MAKIQELSELLTNQIAAGEVIERPASVVKELIENAIDAGSTQIDILIEEAGLKKIKLIDNGEGIPTEEVLNAFKRHATSKIYSRDDLFRIRTLGFRGEALPSIASVSEVTLETSTGDQEGAFIYLRGGKVIEKRSAQSRKGTTITVENLFFNTPARLKYVKTIQTELANITDIVNRMAISHPGIAFRLVHDESQLMRTAGNGHLKQTLAGIYGVALAKKMRKIEGEDLDFQISGYISLPEMTRASRNYLSIIINGRYIKNYLLNKAIIAGYRSKLMVGRFPIAVIEITADPLLMDVNVHPTKQEIRISKEKELMALIESAIHQCLSKEQLIPEALGNLTFKKKTNVIDEATEQTKLAFSNHLVNQGQSTEKILSYDDVWNKLKLTSKDNQKTAGASKIDFETITKEEVFVLNESEDSLVKNDKTSLNSISPPEHQASYLQTAEKLMEANEKSTAQEIHLPSLEYIGQMHGTYLFAQNEEGLYVLDQHAAQERIKYEYFRKKIGEVSTDLQELLVPIILDYPNSDTIKIKENQQALEDVGVHLELFGQNSFLLRSHPVWFDKGAEEQVVKELIDLLLEKGAVNIAKFREATAIMMSCKGSIKANHHLNDAEARSLLNDLAKTKNPYNCPHGRPVLIRFTNNDMEKMFKRIQDSH
ncbi:DNA mismatch repair protein MutL [Carnobacterium iners]|uniref:DNA mismatch repair protein MutL n=1 Tax=Carnobacterium iners TaxID=1073423 RepID=A0A1X7NQV9_9LACT|nr:DNA mismatch repair endonuclease MutL [Carnobacterium iners]SEK26278.1 DNA mismatch repair protein MutL [Carnobacterium iners]SMH40388.1 DNA mismatch repair protein MutL [Carnobacterium iners]